MNFFLRTLVLLSLGLTACGSGPEDSPRLLVEDDSGVHYFDEEISREVGEAFRAFHSFEQNDIHYAVRQGVVVLMGTVSSPLARTRAAYLARQVLGVHRVINRLRVKPVRPGPREVAAAA